MYIYLNKISFIKKKKDRGEKMTSNKHFMEYLLKFILHK